MPARIPRWFLCVILISPGWYLASANGAADRDRLAVTDSAIGGARADIRALETEFAARANLAQLGRWSAQIHALAVPRPEQFVSEMGLAALDRHPPAPVAPAAAATAGQRADSRPPQLAMLEPARPEDAGFDGLRSTARGEGRGLR